MMHNIKIALENPISSDVDFFLDGEPLIAHAHGRHVSLSVDSDMGLHLLSLHNRSAQQISIKGIEIDGTSLDYLVYFSWLIDEHGKKLQPATTSWCANQTWYLPLGFPLSFWISLVRQKIQDQHLGKDLDQFYYIHWPDRYQLTGDYPRLIHDYFSHNFDFFCAPRSQGPHSVPWIPANISVDPGLIESALQEIDHRRTEIWQEKEADCGQNSDGTVRDRGRDQWHIARRGQWFYTPDQWPSVFALLRSLDLHGLSTATIGFLQPRGYIAPHIDKYAASTSSGLSDLYIPLRWPRQNLFKFVGSPALQEAKPMLANTTGHVHALVNDSEHERIILTVCMDKTRNDWLYGDHLQVQHS